MFVLGACSHANGSSGHDSSPFYVMLDYVMRVCGLVFWPMVHVCVTVYKSIKYIHSQVFK